MGKARDGKKAVRWAEIEKELIDSESHEVVESEAVRWAAAGDKEAFEYLFGNYSERLYSFLLRWLANEHSAEDVLQETAIRAYRKFDRYKPSASLRAWLFRIAVNEAKSYVRAASRASRRQKAFAEEKRVPVVKRSVSMEYHVSVTVKEALESLNSSDRRLLLLRFYEELSVADVAKVVRAPATVVKMRIHRARSRFKKSLVAIDGGGAGAHDETDRTGTHAAV